MLRTDRHERVCLLTLDRPDARNAFNTALYDETRVALVEAAESDACAAVVITGNGTAFSAGVDLAAMADVELGGQELARAFDEFYETVATYPKPLLAAVNGAAVGIGFTMLLHCDLVLVNPRARLRAPFTALGLCPEASASVLLPEAIGWQRAAYALFTSEWIEGARAVELGIAWSCVDADDLVAEALRVAHEIAEFPIPSLVATKRLMLAARAERVAAGHAREQAEFPALTGAPANVEAVTAFLEKRPPDFGRIPGA
ncbi:MAG: enoyl-CoA hydratase-related protein [Acidimicrobiia bacterium]